MFAELPPVKSYSAFNVFFGSTTNAIKGQSLSQKLPACQQPNCLYDKLAAPSKLEEADFDVEEFLGILPEVPDKKPEVTCEPGEIVVELRIGEKFAGGGGVVV